MKVALVHQRWQRGGGLETRMINYVNYFQQRGDEVTIVTGRIDTALPIPNGVQLIDVKLRPVPKPLRILFFNRRVAAVMESHSFDFVLSMGRTYSQDNLIAPNTNRGYLQALGRTAWRPLDALNSQLDVQSFQSSKSIFACSDMIKQEVVDLYQIDVEKVYTLYPPFDDSRFKLSGESQGAIRARLGLDNNRKYLLLASSSHGKKGMPLLNKVMEALPDSTITLLVMGATFKPQQGNIISLGYQQEVADFFKAADLTIHPSVYEPFGQVITESLFCQTPVLVSERTGAKEILSSKEGQVVEGFAVNDWTNAILKALDTTFEIDRDFIAQKKLSIQDHVNEMLRIAGVG